LRWISGTRRIAIAIGRNARQDEHETGKREQWNFMLGKPNELRHCGDNAGERGARAN